MALLVTTIETIYIAIAGSYIEVAGCVLLIISIDVENKPLIDKLAEFII